MRALVTAGSLIAAGVVVASPAHADGGHDGWTSQNSTDAHAKEHSFVATSTSFFVDPDGKTHEIDTSHDRTPSPYEYQVHRFAGICNDDALGQPQDLVFVDRRLVAAGPNAPWDPTSAFCASPNAQPVDLGDIAAQAETVTQTLTPPPPAIQIQPDGTTLVGNPTVFSASDLADVTPPALVNPLSGRALQLTVQPSTWTWNFGDGSAPSTTNDPPPPYTTGTPRSALLTHTYMRAADVVVTVTVTWTASYTISGVAGVQAVANRVTSQRTLPLRVRQARSQLVSH